MKKYLVIGNPIGHSLSPKLQNYWLKQNNLNVKPWIFWPRRPLIMENYLENNKTKSYNERTIESIFIGNIYALAQKKIMRMLAYSGVANSGFIFLAIFTSIDFNFSVAAFYVITYTITTVSAISIITFISNGFTKQSRTRTRNNSRLRPNCFCIY